ncbi:MAG: enoyl-CoA hydratase-related protein [Chloroflexota bacterium]|nr:enoyl-CoA hydratase-related protein [Dehalococcoidia bacterium]MDW8255264.1 enoyl-CoA hydratase-related protein [Chloroflexota bacterium]
MDHVLYERQGPVAIATLNRPEKRNALALQTYAELSLIVRDVESTSALRVLIITGAGNAFSAGADVDEVLDLDETVEAAVGRFTQSHAFIALLRSLSKPVIAAINGDAAGAGCSVALAADIRLMAETARIGLTFARVGLGPDMGASYFLPRLVGLAKAYELAFTGDLISAADAERIGLVNRVLPPDRLLPEALALAQRIARGPALALAVAKRALERGLLLDLGDVLQDEIVSQSLLLNSRDGREGLRAFREKRQPDFA